MNKIWPFRKDRSVTGHQLNLRRVSNICFSGKIKYPVKIRSRPVYRRFLDIVTLDFRKFSWKYHTSQPPILYQQSSFLLISRRETSDERLQVREYRLPVKSVHALVQIYISGIWFGQICAPVPIHNAESFSSSTWQTAQSKMAWL